MVGQAGEARKVLWALCAAGLPALAGCLSFVHPIEAPTQAQCAGCQAVSGDCRDHVHIFLLHGLDPLDCANLSGLRDYLVGLGFKNVHYGQCVSGPWFRDQIAEIDRGDPEARFAVIGYCVGACAAQALCERLAEETVPVHLLIYLDGLCVRSFRCKPDRKQPRVVSVIAPALLCSAPTLPEAENVHVPASWHFGAPSHPETLALLGQELAELADSVTPLPPAAEETPATSRKVPPTADVVYHASQTPRALRRLAPDYGPPATTASKPAAPKVDLQGSTTSNVGPPAR